MAAGGVGLASGIDASAGNAPPRSVASDSSALPYSSLAAVAQLIETKQVSPLEVTQCLLDRIAAVDGRLHSYATVTADRALASARSAEGEILAGRYRGPLHCANQTTLAGRAGGYRLAAHTFTGRL